MNQTEKSKIIEEVQISASRSIVAVVTHYRGLTVADMTDLRRKCRKAGVEFRVIKNTLARRAMQGGPFEPLSALLAGPTGVAFSADPAAPSKVLEEFIKTHPKMQVMGGVLEGKLLDPVGIMALAQLPSREVLLARLLGSLMSPIQGFASVLAAIPAGLVRALDQIRRQKEAANAEPAVV